MGVWIETVNCLVQISQASVTPCMGVWIETQRVNSTKHIFMSHPVWVCGLKLPLSEVGRVLRVTPCMGVWIET